MSSPSKQKRMSSTVSVSPVTPDSSWPPLERLTEPPSPDPERSRSDRRRSAFAQWTRRARTPRLRDEIPSIPISPKTVYTPYRPGQTQTQTQERFSTRSVSVYSRPVSSSPPSSTSPPPPIPPRSYDRHVFQYQPPSPLADIDEFRAENSTSRLNAPFTAGIPDDVLLQHTGNAAPPAYNAPRESPLQSYLAARQASFARQPSVQSIRQLSVLGVLKAFLRFFVLLTSATAVGLLGHSVTLYRNTAWPAGTSLVPTVVLLAVALVVLLVSLGLLVLSGVRSGREGSWENALRLLLGIGMMCAWAAGLAVFRILDESASGMNALLKVACGMQGSMSAGVSGLVCTEQDVAFWIALAAAIAEVLLLAAVLADFWTKPGSGSKRWREHSHFSD